MKRFCTNESFGCINTRTLLITNIKTQEDMVLLKQRCADIGDVRETYSLPDNSLCLFVIFYDLRHAIKAKSELDKATIGSSIVNVYFTASKYEIPKEGDLCDDERNQGTLLMVSRNLDAPLTNEEITELFSPFGDIKEIREYRTFQKFIEFWDTRNTVKAYTEFGEKKFKTGSLMLRYLWDTTKKMRWGLIRNTDMVLEGLKGNTDIREIKEVKQNKKHEKNVFARAMDDFLVEKIDEIRNFLLKM